MPGILKGFSRRIRRLGELAHLAGMARRVRAAAGRHPAGRPVVFFNASTRISGLSQNAGFSLLAAWALRLAGVRVVHFVCRAGMSRCLLGTDETNLEHPMPCGMCIRQSRVNFSAAETTWFTYQRDEALERELQDLSLEQLLAFEKTLPASTQGNLPLADPLPLGRLVLPSLRWRLRLQSLQDDEPTRKLCREFMLSAWNVGGEFLQLLESIQPQAAVLFNGMHFPEATAAWLCTRLGVRAITHESGFQPYSGYFVDGQVTMYPITIPEGVLTPGQDARLDADLQKRWQGDFSMAGVKFWQEIHELGESLKAKITAHSQVVAVFTNVIFDTSQLHANKAFADMFDWLDALLEVIRRHPETLFIVRAHPDEARPGKTSRESVAGWMERSGAAALENVVFIAPQERVNSYDLVKASKFILVYNSTISLESTLLGTPALCAARSPFTDYGTAYFEAERGAYLQRLESFLTEEFLQVSPEAVRRTRRFIYYRYYRFSLPFGDFVEATVPTGYIRLKRFSLPELASSPTLRAVLHGLLHGGNFELEA